MNAAGWLAGALTMALLLAGAVDGRAQPPAQTPTSPAPAGSAGTRPAEERREPITVDADRMERYGKQSLVVFTGKVVARQAGSVHYADRTEVYLDEKGDRVVRIVSTGNVRVVTKDCKSGTARRAEYSDLEQRIVLTGNARVWDDDNVVTGDTITIYLAEDRSLVEGGRHERVRAVFHPRSRQGSSAAGEGRAPKSCAE